MTAGLSCCVSSLLLGGCETARRRIPGRRGRIIVDSRIEDALARAVELGEEGIQVAAFLGDELIVDAWAGSADPPNGRAVDGETLFPVFSVTKGYTAVALHVLAERGLIDYDAPVAKYWPEFAANGKGATTVRHVLMHRSGIPMMPVGVTPELMCDWDWMVREIANLTPVFEPGTTNAYHTLVFGWIVAEIVRRVDPANRPFGQFFQEEVCAPLGINDLYMGVPDTKFDRVARLVADWEPKPYRHPLLESGMPVAISAAPPVHNRHDVWRACLPGSGAIANARSSARLFAMLANGGEFNGTRLLSEASVRSFLQPRDNVQDKDRVYNYVAYVGVGGLWVQHDLLDRPNTLHHAGAGGSIGWAELDSRLSVAICHNKMRPVFTADPATDPCRPIIDAVHAVAGC
jgi:CubicO group peptidase (beta-lactamase class C family)